MSEPLLKRHHITGLVVSVVGAVAVYLGISIWGGRQEVAASFALIGWGGLAVALALSLVNYGLRFARWQSYLAALGHPINTRTSGLIYVAGFALTTTPGKAGEMLRSVFLKTHGVGFRKSTAAFLSERLSDMVAIVLLALVGAGAYPQSGVLQITGIALIGCSLLFLTQAQYIDKLAARLWGWAGRGMNLLSSLLKEARACHTAPMLAKATLLGVAGWAAEAYAFYLILQWMGVEVGMGFAFSVFALGMLGGALSFMPGGIGGTEAVMIAMLLWAGVSEAQAVAATVIIRLTTLWFAVGLGGLVLLFGGRSLAR